MQEILSEIYQILVVSLPAILAICGFAYAIVFGIVRFLPDSSKSLLEIWMVTATNDSWSKRYVSFLDGFFGGKLNSLTAIRRSFLVSFFTTAFLVFVFSVSEYWRAKIGGKFGFGYLIIIPFLISALGDYFSVVQTRWLIQKISAYKLNILIYLVLDLLASFAIAAVFSYAGYLAYSWVHHDETVELSEIISGYTPFSIFFYTTFFTSIWALVFVFATLILRFLSELFGKNLLAVEGNSGRIIGGATAVGVFFLGSVGSLITVPKTNNLSFVDEFICSNFPGAVCIKAGLITSDKTLSNALILKGCSSRTQSSCMNAALRVFDGDIEVGLNLLKISCDSGYLQSCNYLGLILFDTNSSISDIERAHHYYELACDGGLGDACNDIGVMHEDGKLFEKNAKKAVSYYAKGCEQASGLACSNAGALYMGFDLNDNVPSNSLLALDYLRKSCSLEDAGGCLNLGVLLRDNDASYGNYEQGRTLFRKACKLGEPIACANLAYIKKWGDNRDKTTEDKSLVDPDLEDAFLLATRGCDLGNARSCSYLAQTYRYGSGTFKNIEKSFSLYRKSCSLGDTNACKSGCDFGDGPTCRITGKFYEEGEGISSFSHMRNAHYYYKKGCEEGDKLSCEAVTKIAISHPEVTKKLVVPAWLKGSATVKSDTVGEEIPDKKDNYVDVPAWLKGSFDE